MCFEKTTTIKDVVRVMDEFKNIKRPDADNEGDAANAPDFYNFLSDDDQKIVDNTLSVVNSYIRNSDGSPNEKAITQMNKSGYSTSLYEGQYSENGELVGQVKIQTNNNEDDDIISLDLSD
ncbi:MAG: hypothetical protein U9N30_05555 [Campylobacterota bacterium]|nr:hypothetical protein [Campylobacterota bacterium]